MNEPTKKTTVGVLSMAEIVAKSPDPVAAIQALGKTVARSQMMGPVDRAEIGEVLVMLCITEGWTLAELFRTYQISFGRLEKRIDAGMAEFLARGGKITWLADGSDGIQARAKFTLGADSIEAGCTVEEAKKAGWAKNQKWTTEPTTMLRARVKKRGVLALCPDIFFGEYADEDRPEPNVAVDGAAMATAAAAVAATRSAPPAPVVPAAAAAPATPAPSTVAPQAPAPVLSGELQEKLVAIIGPENIPQAQAWAVSVGWLGAGDSIEALPEKHAKAIIAKPDRFQAALKAFIEKGGAK